MTKTIVIRADASTQIGTGHVMRCLALAQAWQDAKGDAVFIIATEAPALEGRLKSEGMRVLHLSAKAGSANDAIQTANVAQQIGASWLVVDGYHFDDGYQKIVKDSGLRLLFIDDNGHADHYYADIVLNQNIHAYESLYSKRESYTRLLLGTRYVLLRREFSKWRGWEREIHDIAHKVLVTMGGADSSNVILKVIHALRQVKVEGIEVAVAVGGENPHYEELKSAIKGLPFIIRLERNVINMPELMAWADVAISSGGTTAWELVYMGLPCFLYILSPNQEGVVNYLESTGAVINLRKPNEISIEEVTSIITKIIKSSDLRKRMIDSGQNIVDGYGDERLILVLKGGLLRGRKILLGDSKLLWEWVNDQEVRAWSFQSEPISWETHSAWLINKLEDSNVYMYIFFDQFDLPIGQVRFELQSCESAKISVSIAHDQRSKGYGTEVIKLACKLLFEESDVNVIDAYIKPNNIASIRTFKKAGFIFKERTSVVGINAHLLTFKR